MSTKDKLQGKSKMINTDIIIQDRSRLFRESCKASIEASSDLRVVGLFSDGDSMVPAAKTLDVGGILFELGDVPWDVSQLISQLLLLERSPILVGIKGNRNSKITYEGIACINRTSHVREIVAALNGRKLDRTEIRLSDPSSVGANAFSLTEREYQVLILIARGLTTSEIGNRLGLSPKTIESRRQTLFSKLGVQNQSHAVAVAAKTGMLGNDSIAVTGFND